MKSEMQTAADAAADMAQSLNSPPDPNLQAKSMNVSPMVEQQAQELTPATTDSQADVLLQAVNTAVAAGQDADTIEKLLAMSERIMDRKASEVFWNNFHQARAEMPAIKAQGNNDGKAYAKLEDTLEVIEPIYSKYGFSMLFWGGDSPVEGMRRIYCKLAHVGGHVETFDTDLPLDSGTMTGKANKTQVQACGSTDSYGQRYLTEKVWNLRVLKNPHDDDGKGAGAVELLTDEQAANLRALWDEVGGDLSKFLQPYGCEDFEHMPQKFLKRAIRRLEQKRKGGK